jgi:hypothetical protein
MFSQIAILHLRLINSAFPYEGTDVPTSRSTNLVWLSLLIMCLQDGTFLTSPFRGLEFSDISWIIAKFVHLCVSIRKRDTSLSSQINYVLTCSIQVHSILIKRLPRKERL